MLAALGLDARDLRSTSPEPPASHPPRETVYPYVDELGGLLFQVVRKHPKKFLQRRPHQGDWIWNLKNTRRVLYHLPDVIRAVAAGEIVYITEGEKDADTARQSRVVATTNPGGAGKWDDEYTPFFTGATVRIVADRDPAGNKHARDVAARLEGTAASVEILQPAVGNDLTAHITAGKTLAELEPFDVATSDPSETCRAIPTIDLAGGELHDVVRQAEDALLSAAPKCHIFQCGGRLVRVARTPCTSSGVRHPAVALSIIEVTTPYLITKLTEHARFERFVQKEKTRRSVDCPERVAKAYLSLAGEWRVPNLVGIVGAPTLRRDGSILEERGYDPDTQLFYDPGAVEFPQVPVRPTHDHAVAALERLHHVIKDFPWAEECDRSVALAAILTALVRRALPSAPMFVFRSPTMGSGKSLLADVVALIATGRPAPAMTQGRDEDEDKKRMLSLLLEAEPIVCIDNVERPLGGAALCSILTQPVYKDRVLGRSGTATVPTTAMWMATGNNLQLVGDLTTRALPCDIDPAVERPEERTFDLDPREYCARHRAELVVAGLTALRAYVVAGRPSVGVRPFGRFERWSETVRSALIWCGYADPCHGRRRLETTDPVREQLRLVLIAWHELVGDTPVTLREVIKDARTRKGSALMDAFCEVAPGHRPDEPNRTKLGRWIGSYEGRLEGGLRFVRAGSRKGSVIWAVDEVGVEGVAGQFQAEPGKGGSDEGAISSRTTGSSPQPPPPPPADTAGDGEDGDG